MRIIRVGRNSANDIVINDPLVTRENHCQFIQDDLGNFKIIDASTNGTFVNGIRIGRGTEKQLNNMDVIRIGNTTLPWQTYFNNGGGTIIDNPKPISGNGGISNGNNIVINNGNAGGQAIQPGAKPDNFLVWSILCIICCCMPFGIVSTVYAAKVDNLWAQGQYAQAIEAASAARKWFWWGFGIGAFLDLIVIIYYIVIVGIAVSL